MRRQLVLLKLSAGGLPCFDPHFALISSLSTRLAANFPQNTELIHLTPVPSHLCALFFASEHSQPLSLQALAHSFLCNGGWCPFTLRIPSLSNRSLRPGQKIPFFFPLRVTGHGPQITGRLLKLCGWEVVGSRPGRRGQRPSGWAELLLQGFADSAHQGIARERLLKEATLVQEVFIAPVVFEVARHVDDLKTGAEAL